MYGNNLFNNRWSSSIICTTEEVGQVQDVVIDAIGVLIGISVLLLFVKVYKRYKK